jgi:hypothetical protein
MTWNVYALFNHDLGQIFIGASDTPKHALQRHCAEETRRLKEWSATAHRIDWMESVEAFHTHREARAYANWLLREGAFEGTEDFTMGLQAALA